MKNSNSVKSLCIAIVLNFMVTAVSTVWAENLIIDPASPIVEAGGQIALTVTNAVGDVRWYAFDGQIQGEGSSVTYLAPDESGTDMVAVLDDKGNGGMAIVIVKEPAVDDDNYLICNRAAIIIAGGGNSDDNALWDATSKISNYIYKMLNRRGFMNRDIHYISPTLWADFNGDDIDDKIVDAPNTTRQLTTQDIQDAFDWAKTKGDLNQPLYIFFTGHGGNNRLQLAKGVYIEGSELKTMIDDYQQNTGNKVVIVIDAAHSGTFLPSLAGENRAVISSTDDGVAYFDRLNGQSFIWYVTKGLIKGMNFNEAFYYASSEYKKALGKISQYESISSGTDIVNLSQEPQFDDNGDGVYNISVDGEWLKTVSINGTWSMAASANKIQSITESGNVSAFEPATLKVKATPARCMVNKRVWASITPPAMDKCVDESGVQILKVPTVEMNQSKTETDVWEGSWNGFVYNGEYEIIFYAQDNEGNIEGSESIKLTVGDGLPCPERASLKVSADKTSYQSGESLKISVTENLAYGYDLYAALLMPDGNFIDLKSPLTDLTQLKTESFNHLYQTDKWNTQRDMGRPLNVVDMVLTQDTLSQIKLPSGQYCLYAALIPEGQDLMVSAEKGLFVLDGVCFEVRE